MARGKEKGGKGRERGMASRTVRDERDAPSEEEEASSSDGGPRAFFFSVSSLSFFSTMRGTRET
jgi:hypothetical protein